jgi:hypothetical protein
MKWLAVLLISCVGCQAAVIVPLVEAPLAVIDGIQRRHEVEKRARADQQTRASADQLLQSAIKAATAGDCVAIAALAQSTRTLTPPRHDPDAFYDRFVAEPSLRPCFAKFECERARNWVASHPELTNDPYMRERTERACNPPPVEVVAQVAPVPREPAPRAPCANARAVAYETSRDESTSKRLESLGLLPTCPAAAPREKADEQVWQWTIVATTSALRGSCAFATDFDDHVRQRDAVHHAEQWSKDPAIAACQYELAKFRTDRERCLRERAAALRQAQTITNTQRRGQALSSIPRCPSAR